jgi:hypothetical protein
LLGSIFNPEDARDMFIQNDSWLSLDYTALYATKLMSSFLLNPDSLLHFYDLQISFNF